MSILLFFAVIFVLVLVHEWGHFITAKKTGMRVDEFGIGFPPKLFSFKKGETEYSFNALPIGGFVRIYGENSEDAASDAAANKDISRSFVSKPKWAQAIVLVAGVTMNILFAWVLFALVFMVGIPTAVDEADATEQAELVISSVLPDSPAAEAGLMPGTIITEASRSDVALEWLTPRAFSEFTQNSSEPITLETLVGETSGTVTIAPAAGIIEAEPNRTALGVSLALVEEQSLPIHEALYEATRTTIASLQAITVGLASLIANSFRGTADFSQIAGPVGIVGLVGDAAEFGFTSLLMFTAIISLNLAVINMLPFPALDGGRLLFVAIEAVTRKAIKPVWVYRLNTVGFILLIVLMVAVTYNDILRLL